MPTRRSPYAKLAETISTAPRSKAGDAIAKLVEPLVLGGHFEAALHCVTVLATGPLAVPAKSLHRAMVDRLGPALASVLDRPWEHSKEPPFHREAIVFGQLCMDAFAQFPAPADRPVDELERELDTLSCAPGANEEGPARFPVFRAGLDVWRGAQRDTIAGSLATARKKLALLLGRYAPYLPHHVVSQAQIVAAELALREGESAEAERLLRDYASRGDEATRWSSFLFELSGPMRLLSTGIVRDGVPTVDDAKAVVIAIDSRPADVAESAGRDWKSILKVAGIRAKKGAPKKDLEALETRIGRKLPPSYRSFLETTNGAPRLSDSHPALLAASEVDWFHVSHREWIDAWTRDAGPEPSDETYFVYGDGQDAVQLRVRYLSTVLQIGEAYDGGVYLLNPEVVDASGEWEAWFLASWLPGASRYRSFREMLEERARCG